VRVEELVVAGVVHAQVMPLVEGRDLRRVLQAVIGAGEVVPVAVAPRRSAVRWRARWRTRTR
jgi:hypothetical protein